MEYVEIPPDRLQPEVFRSVLEEFINREGTNYGETELSMDQKRENLQGLIASGEVSIVFDPNTETCTLIERDELQVLRAGEASSS